MFCEPCRRERPFTRFCVWCGAGLIRRSTPLIEADLEKVRWLLDEVTVWDESLAPRSGRTHITEYYRRQEATLVAALAPEPPPSPVQETPSRVELTPSVVLALPLPLGGEGRGEGEAPQAPPALAPEGEREITPSRWQLTWKPFLHESLGWFLGAFLILSGALYLVADAWAGMTSTVRALTVFGLVEAWAIGFTAWAGALARKETTRPAAVGLRRIAALVAPLAVLALGPALSSVFSWLALLGGTALAGALAFRAAKDLEEPDAPLLTASFSLATLGLGLAPVLPVAGAWFLLLPTALAAFAFRSGPRTTPSRTVVTLLSFTVPVAAVIIRLLISEPHAQITLAAMCVAAAALASSALWLRDEKTHAPLSIVAMSVFFVAFLASFAVAAPACVLIAVLGIWTTWRMSSVREKGDARWLIGTYVFAYLSWQRVDQLVPAIVWTWWDQLKVMLGYAAAPMPASYGSVYQSIFIAVGTLVAGWQLWKARPSPVHPERVERNSLQPLSTARSSRAESRDAAHIWLRCSAVAASAAGALAMVSVNFDARPAVVALPILLIPLLLVGVLARRTDALAAGSLLSVFFAIASGLTVSPAWPAGLVAVVLALGAHALPAARNTRVLRFWLAGASAASAAVTFLLAALVPGTAALIALTLGSLACVLAARAIHRRLVTLAWFTALIPLATLQSPVVWAIFALAGAALLFVRGRRFRTAIPAFVVMALLAPLWTFTAITGVTWRVELNALVFIAVAAGLAMLPLRRWWWAVAIAGASLAALLVPSSTLHVPPGWPWLFSAAALGLLSTRLELEHRRWLQAPALLALVVSIAPNYGLWQEWSHHLTLLCAGGFALGSSVDALRKGRTWQGTLLAALALVAALATVKFGQAPLEAIAAVVLLATPALLPWITVPLTALLLGIAWFDVPYALLGIAVVTAAVALFEESDWAWRNVLNRASITWAASLTSALALLAALLASGRNLPVSIAAVLLPLVWARATRRAEPLALGVAFAAAAGPWWCAPLFALVAGRLLELAPIRRLFAIPTLEGAPLKARRELEEAVLFFVSAAVAGLCVAFEPSQGLAWAPALLLMGGTLPALRLSAAVAVAVPFEPLRAPVVGVLVALGAAAHHAPAHLKRLLGVRSLKYVVPVALLLATAGAGVLSGISPPTAASPFALLLAIATVGLLVCVRLTTAAKRRAFTAVASLALGGTVALLGPQWMLPVTIGAAAVLLGVPGLIPVAIFAAGLDLFGTLSRGVPVLAPQLFTVAFVAALLAMALRWARIAQPAASLWRWLGRESDTALAGPIYWGALILGSLLLAHGDSHALWLAPLFLVTPQRAEAVPGFIFAALAIGLLLPREVVVPLTSAAALGFASAGTQFTRLRVANLWRHVSWLLALMGLVFAGVNLESPLIPLAWSAGAATTWLLLRGRDEARGWAWAATGVALHVVMAFVGVVLSTGAPQVMIIPWWAAASGALALLRHLGGGKTSVIAFSSVALVELLLGTSLLAAAHPREAVVSVLVAGVLAFIAWRRVVSDDEEVSAWMGQCAVVMGALAARVLGMGAMPNLTDAWVLLGASAAFAGLSQLLAREGREDSARALRFGAMAWPVLGAVLVPWTTWSLGAGWLVGLSALAAWIARAGSRRSGALLSAVALNAAVLLAGVGSGFEELQLLLIPLGLTLLVLARVFSDELSLDAGVQLRAWGMGFMYAAVAWKPLMVTSVPALVLCVLVCLGGVALGAMWRIRSYVVLGSGVLVVTVLATLVRSGLAEPRLGAVFLSLLGLAVVVVMVGITTRREELQARFAAMQRAMATWEG